MRHRAAAASIAVLLVAASCAGGDDDAGPTTLPGDGVAAGARDTGGSVAGIELDGFDGAPVRLDDYVGRPLVVNVFASWCAPCVREMPGIERVKQDVGDEVAFLGIAQRDRIEDAEALIEDTGVTWDVALDPEGEAVAELGVLRMPTTFLVSADGEIVAEHGGLLEEDDLRDLLREQFGVEA